MTVQTPLAPLPFYKMHGLGNDFVVIDARAGDDPVTPALARAVADRHRGVGFDQLVVIRAVAERGVAAAVDFWNADGSMAQACGNATRCVADLLMAETGADALSLSSVAGDLACARLADGRIRVNMGRPKLDWREIPLAEASYTERIDVKLGPIDAPVLWGPGAVNMGNPHAVFFVDDVEAQPIERIGPLVENHPMFPERANVGFAEPRGRDRVRLRVWERGAGVTLACGSNACAAVVAGVRRDLLDRQATVELDGGALEIAWDASDDCVYMSGPAQMVFAGALDPGFLATVAASREPTEADDGAAA